MTGPAVWVGQGKLPWTVHPDQGVRQEGAVYTCGWNLGGDGEY